MAHIWAKAPVPIEYIRVIMCRDVYHCTPNELRNVSLQDIYQDMIVISAETRVMQYRLKAHGKI